MTPKDSTAAGRISGQSKKRKGAPQSSPSEYRTHGNGREGKRRKALDARSILTQSSDAALSNGELDLQAFLNAREFEIGALEDTLRKSKGVLATRTFQQVPRDMRRRTASHNVKRVPRRYQKRAAREMKADNTPITQANKRKPGTTRGRIRAETAKRLGLLSQKRQKLKAKSAAGSGIDGISKVVGRTPKPKTKRGELSAPPKPPSKFRKRQINKTWLPTHIFHAKRAKMTEPKKPLWRMAIPLTPTQKCYRPTHRAGGARGALCWDVSYMSTVGLEGTELALEKVLRAVGITQDGMWSYMGAKWRQGKRTWSGWMSREDDGLRKKVAPVLVVWCHAMQTDPAATASGDDKNATKPKKPHLRRIFVRVHPAAFLELWNELLRLSKMQRPQVQLEDLRFEIGSIEITGPSATEALLGVLYPYDQSGIENDEHAKVFKSLAGVTNSASLPSNALLAFSIMDPRLRYPPRMLRLPIYHDEESAFSLLRILTQWPADQSSPSPALFDRDARFKATRLPSQKSINRRKAAAATGEYPSQVPADQPIPVMLCASRAFSTGRQGTWTLLAPWKCILPIWYCLVHCPLLSGGNPRFGGLQELQQIHFEHGKPWFPGDYPGTEAGLAWEMDERQRRKEEWQRRPKGRRAEFQTLDLGAGRKGEIGLGWACDFEALTASVGQTSEKISGSETFPNAEVKTVIPPYRYLSSTTFSSLLTNPEAIPSKGLVTVRITLFSRGVPQPCARIYRLPATPPSLSEMSTEGISQPAAPSLRAQWLAQAPPSWQTSAFNPKVRLRCTRLRNAALNISSVPPAGRSRALAGSLLQTPPLRYPALGSDNHQSPKKHPLPPNEDDLIGFVTTGNFSLAEGKGIGIGSLLVSRVLESFGQRRRKEESGMSEWVGETETERERSKWVGKTETERERERERIICIVRNAGEAVGRLGVWEVV